MKNKPKEGYFLVTFVVFLLLANCHGCYGASSGHEIWDYLFLNGTYNNEVRPVKDWGTPTHVNVSVAVIAVVDFNEVKQTIILTSKLTIVWKDEYLVWDPLNFGNITHIHVLQSKVWKPYLFLENSVSKQPDMGSPSVNLIVSHEGVVEWNPVEVFKSTCAADVRKFPFDTQKCSMVFETQGYTNQEIEIHSVEDHIDFHGYGITSGWYVEDTDIETQSENGAEIHILCSLTLRRNPTYFILNIFLPIVLLSFMNLCVFILPVQSGEKASFVITVFLSLAVFLTIVSSNLPENTDNVSILNIYVCICTLLSVIIAFLTIIQIRLYHRDSNMPIPPLLLKLVILFTSKGRRIDKGSTDTIPNKAAQKQQKKNIIDVIPLDDTIRDDKNKDKETLKVLITWPDVVQAFDNIFLVVFLMITISMTMTVLILAARKEELPEEHESH